MSTDYINKFCAEQGGLKEFSSRVAYPGLSGKFEFMHQVWEMNCGIASTVKALEGKNEDEILYKGTVQHLTWKALKTHLAIESLLESGFIEDAHLVIRSLLEIVINLAYIQRDPEYISRIYVEYSFLERHRFLETGKMIYGENHFSAKGHDEEIKQLESDYERVKNNYQNKNKWSGCSIRRMAEQVGLVDDYDLIYSYLSQSVHSTALTANSYVQEGENGLVIVIMPGQEEEKYFQRAICLTCSYSLMLIEIFNQVFNLGFQEEIHTNLHELKIVFK